MKITTKTGDKGRTSLFGGRRVSKEHELINLLGEIDELQAFIAWAKCAVKEEGLVKVLMRIGDDLYRMMSIVGFEFKVPKNIKPLNEKDVEFLEKQIGAHQQDVSAVSEFVRPGGSEAASRLHIARCVCRRAERNFVKFMQSAGVGAVDRELLENILKYLNRLSDLLFIYAYLTTGSRK